MSDENVAVVRELLDAFQRRDHEREFELQDENIVYDCTRVPMPGCNEVFLGHSGVRTYWRRWLEAWEEIEFRLVEVVDLAGRVLVGFEQRQKGHGSGIWIDWWPWWGVYEVRAGKVVKLTYFNDRDEAVAAAGPGRGAE